MDEDSLPFEGSEKRKDHRVFCDVNIVLNEEANSIVADFVDISESGFRLVGSQSFPLQKSYELIFTLDNETQDIECIATVVWVDNLPDKKGKVTSGFKFSKMSVDDRVKLRRYIQKQRNKN